MEQKKLGQKLKELRELKGFSQELLADKAELNLRTIQRIENGETNPRGDSLKRLSETLQVSPEELIEWKKQPDKSFLAVLNISSLSFIINPLLGVIVPLILWVSKRDRIENADQYGKTILNFQVSMIAVFSLIILFSGIINITLKSTLELSFIEWFGPFLIFYIPIGIYYIYNIILIVKNIIRIKKGKSLKYFPMFKVI